MGHATPPFAAATVTVRVCVWMPEPHDEEQAPNTPNALTTQLTGHACVLHDWMSVNGGHTAPPFAATTVTVRVRVYLPLPQLSVHELNAPHALTAQSIGHAATANTLLT